MVKRIVILEVDIDERDVEWLDWRSLEQKGISIKVLWDKAVSSSQKES